MCRRGPQAQGDKDPEERLAALTRAGHQCASCGADTDLEVDHKASLNALGSNDYENLQALCRSCHSTKTIIEAMAPRERNPLSSVFEASVYESFHQSPKPKQAVLSLNPLKDRPKLLEVDIRGCRRNALIHNKYPLPLYCPLDLPQPVDGKLGDYNFVDLGTPMTRENYLRALPYSGPRWYWRASVETHARARYRGLA